MRFFVYEYLTAGGVFLDGDAPPNGSMLLEGAAMRDAVWNDLGRLPGAELIGLHDARLPSRSNRLSDRIVVTDARSHSLQFDRCVSESDHTLLIAPEINGRLAMLAERAEQRKASLISPEATFVRLATDKVRTIEVLREADVPVPPTYACRSLHDLALIPAGRWVCKPIDGAGSWQVRCVDRDQLARHLGLPLGGRAGTLERRFDPAWCVQAFCDGRPASVAALCGGDVPDLLPPCWQRLAPESFVYQGGAWMTEPALIARAHRLARKAFAALPATKGFVGLDMILGPDAKGKQDVIIEVNPRLTTSFVGLRHRAVPNLGEAMWRRATGQEARLTFLSGPLQFDADGTIRSRNARQDARHCARDGSELDP